MVREIGKNADEDADKFQKYVIQLNKFVPYQFLLNNIQLFEKKKRIEN